MSIAPIPVRPGRKIVGMSAILLPLLENGDVDWQGFRDHVTRTLRAGLVPAVNMDTGYANLLTEALRIQVLEQTQAVCNGLPYLAGAFVRDDAGANWNWDAYRSAIDDIQQQGGLPVIFQSFGLTSMHEPEILRAYEEIGTHSGEFIGFELGTMFAPFGRIYSLEFYERWIQIPQCIGAKHSSLQRSLEWKRLAIRDRVRPTFRVLTGNDLAIDMVMYGSDYLLGLSTMDPQAFAIRDAMWETGDDRFYELNDWLQYLGMFAFRPPVPAYKHNAAQYLHLQGLISTDRTWNGSPGRPSSDREILLQIANQLRRYF